METDSERFVFWMVWRENGDAPTYRHFSKDQAEKEAGRLALQCPGVVFFILKTTGALAAEIPTIKSIKLIIDPIPF